MIICFIFLYGHFCVLYFFLLRYFVLFFSCFFPFIFFQLIFFFFEKLKNDNIIWWCNYVNLLHMIWCFDRSHTDVFCSVDTKLAMLNSSFSGRNRRLQNGFLVYNLLIQQTHHFFALPILTGSIVIDDVHFCSMKFTIFRSYKSLIFHQNVHNTNDLLIAINCHMDIVFVAIIHSIVVMVLILFIGTDINASSIIFFFSALKRWHGTVKPLRFRYQLLWSSSLSHSRNRTNGNNITRHNHIGDHSSKTCMHFF